MSDTHDLQRFVDAQAPIHRAALAEIAAGRKRTHWMWFIFPQIAGLGTSPTARFYAVRTLDEARAYLAHPVLGARLIEAVETLQGLPALDVETVFGAVDAMKLRSSLTLFDAAGAPAIFGQALDRWFDGIRDPATLTLIARAAG